MHPHDSHDDLTDLERRLSAWQPAGQGLSADGMLYTAGRASLRGVVRSRLVWACAACVLGAVALGLAAWLGVERAERQALLAQLRQRPAPVSPTPVPPPVVPPSDGGPPGSDYLTVRNLVLEKGVQAWQGPDASRDKPLSPSPNSRTWQVGRRDGLLEQ
jgi:hypothetical protein